MGQGNINQNINSLAASTFNKATDAVKNVAEGLRERTSTMRRGLLKAVGSCIAVTAIGMALVSCTTAGPTQQNNGSSCFNVTQGALDVAILGEACQKIMSSPIHNCEIKPVNVKVVSDIQAEHKTITGESGHEVAGFYTYDPPTIYLQDPNILTQIFKGDTKSIIIHEGFHDIIQKCRKDPVGVPLAKGTTIAGQILKGYSMTDDQKPDPRIFCVNVTKTTKTIDGELKPTDGIVCNVGAREIEVALATNVATGQLENYNNYGTGDLYKELKALGVNTSYEEFSAIWTESMTMSNFWEHLSSRLAENSTSTTKQKIVETITSRMLQETQSVRKVVDGKQYQLTDTAYIYNPFATNVGESNVVVVHDGDASISYLPGLNGETRLTYSLNGCLNMTFPGHPTYAAWVDERLAQKNKLGAFGDSFVLPPEPQLPQMKPEEVCDAIAK